MNLYETYGGFTDVLTKFWQMDREYVQGQGYVSRNGTGCRLSGLQKCITLQQKH
ncbi:MAG: hypothetical protein ACLU30_03710 [Odoribacter splanchnicus]